MSSSNEGSSSPPTPLIHKSRFEQVMVKTRIGYVIMLSLSLALMISTSIALGGCYWIIKFDAAEDSGCGSYYFSYMLREGACHVDDYGATDDSNCEKWTDSNFWEGLDTYLAANGDHPNFNDATTNYINSAGLVSISVAFSLFMGVVSCVGIFAEKFANVNTIKNFKRKLQLVYFFLAFMMWLFMLSTYSLTCNNDLTNSQYWLDIATSRNPYCVNTLTVTSQGGAGFGFTILAWLTCFLAMHLSIYGCFSCVEIEEITNPLTKSLQA